MNWNVDIWYAKYLLCDPFERVSRPPEAVAHMLRTAALAHCPSKQLSFLVSFSPSTECQAHAINYCVSLPVSFQIYFNPTHRWWPVLCSPLTFNYLFNIKSLFTVFYSKCGGGKWIPLGLLVGQPLATPFWLCTTLLPYNICKTFLKCDLRASLGSPKCSQGLHESKLIVIILRQPKFSSSILKIWENYIEKCFKYPQFSGWSLQALDPWHGDSESRAKPFNSVRKQQGKKKG